MPRLRREWKPSRKNMTLVSWQVNWHPKKSIQKSLSSKNPPKNKSAASVYYNYTHTYLIEEPIVLIKFQFTVIFCIIAKLLNIWEGKYGVLLLFFLFSGTPINIFFNSIMFWLVPKANKTTKPTIERKSDIVKQTCFVLEMSDELPLLPCGFSRPK